MALVAAVDPNISGEGRRKKVKLFANKFLAVHPTVTLSIVDHYSRVAKDSSKRVVGVLLGEYIDGKTHATNSFAVPFEEDLKNASIWFLDHNYLESMAYMFAKISKKERIVGWYSTGSAIKPVDLEIYELMRAYCPHPMFLLVNVKSTKGDGGEDLPFNAYMSFDEPSSDKLFRKSFAHIACGVAQFEAEEVAVEHLLRDLESLSASTRSSKVLDQINCLKCLQQKFADVAAYLSDIHQGNIPMNPRILTNVQNICNLSPNTSDPILIEAMDTHINSSMMAMYTVGNSTSGLHCMNVAGGVVRTVLALHDLVKNRLDAKVRLTEKSTVQNSLIEKSSAEKNSEKEKAEEQQPSTS